MWSCASRWLWLCVMASHFMTLRTLAEHRVFSVEDSVRMTRFNLPNENLQTDAPLFSPDHAAFLVITSRGIPESNRVESTLWVYRSAEVQQFLVRGGVPPARHLMARVSAVPISEAPSSHAAVITQVRWALDSQRVYFLAERGHGNWQLCTTDIHTRRLQRLSGTAESVRYYAFTPSTVVFLRAISTREDVVPTGPRVPIEPVTGRTIESLLVRNDPNHPVLAQLWELRSGKRRPMSEPYVDSGYGGIYTPDTLAISPDGRSILRSHPAARVPSSWNGYQPVPGFPTLRIDPGAPSSSSPYNYFRPRQFVLVDARSGREEFAVDAPIAYGLGYADPQSATWSNDSRRVLLTGTFLPLGMHHRTIAAEILQRPCAAAILEVSSQTLTCIAYSRWNLLRQQSSKEALLLTSANFDSADRIILRFDYPGRTSVVERYHAEGGAWHLAEKQLSNASDAAAPGVPELLVAIRQAVDRRPVLWASDPKEQVGRMLWDPNPDLASAAMGKVSVIRWSDDSGYEWTGGLIKPVGYVPGRRYPLIIQTHGFAAYRFLTDGYYPTAMAAQPLASAGFVVLQIETRRSHYTTREEVDDQVDGFLAAIETLDREGLIDPLKVGLAGFSRTSWYVESALVHHPQRFAVATIADGVDQGYLQYRLFGDTPNIRDDSETIHGGAPRGDRLSDWATYAPPFQADRIEAPVLIQALGARSILMEWEIYASLYHFGKPVDLLYLPDAQHVLQSPRDLVGSEQAVVDWFRFWLLGEERSTPDAKDQYSRWERLKQSRQGKPVAEEQSAVQLDGTAPPN